MGDDQNKRKGNKEINNEQKFVLFSTVKKTRVS